MDLVTVAESRLSASRCVHSHFVIISTFCQLTQLQHFRVDNFPLQTGHMKNKRANKEVFTAHYGDLMRTRWISCQIQICTYRGVLTRKSNLVKKKKCIYESFSLLLGKFTMKARFQHFYILEFSVVLTTVRLRSLTIFKKVKVSSPVLVHFNCVICIIVALTSRLKFPHYMV